MAHGKRSSMLTNSAGKDYWKKRGFLSKCWGWMQGVSHRSGTNKLTKKYTNKSERNQIKKFIKNKEFENV